MKKPRILSIELEPTPYKFDLWNAVYDSNSLEVFNVYTEKKNWSRDGGHNYTQFPPNHSPHIIFSGSSIFTFFRLVFYILKKYLKYKPDAVIIYGYNRFISQIAFLGAVFLKVKIFLFNDKFNNVARNSTFFNIKVNLRNILRKIWFNRSQAVLVCGKFGIDSAIRAGCNKSKIKNFPYVISLKRIKSDLPKEIPNKCLNDKKLNKQILFFSGRMIKRKGLETLLLAVKKIKEKDGWALWIEGDGPLLGYYQSMAKAHSIYEECRFLGFCQYDLHSWLIKSSDIIILPSLQDNWAIVVDEGLQLGKVVISSDATGAGMDRIKNKVNGFLFNAGNENKLYELILELMSNKNKRKEIGKRAMESINNITPKNNLETLLKII